MLDQSPPFTSNWYANFGYYGGPTATFPSNQRPMAVYSASAGKTFFTWLDFAHRVCVASFDHATKVISDATIIATLSDNDAHRNPALLVGADGYIYVFYGSHGAATKVARSASAGSIASFGAGGDITGLTTYPQPYELVSGTLTVMHRVDVDWSLKQSTDQGATWGSATTIITGDSGKWVYAMGIAEAGAFTRKLHVVWTTLDPVPQVRKHLWYAKSENGGGAWKKSDGTSYSLPIATGTAEKIFDSGQNQVNTQDIQLDRAGNPYVMISYGINGGVDSALGGIWTFALIKLVAGVWTAYTIATGDHQFDNGCLVFHADNDIRAILPTGPSSESNGDGGNMQEFRSTDGGATWAPYNTLTADLLIHNAAKTVVNGTAEFRAFWSYGDATNIVPGNIKFLSDAAGVRTLAPGTPFASNFVLRGRE